MRDPGLLRRLMLYGIAPSAALMLALTPTEVVAQAQQFYSVTPCRAVDTRIGYGGIVYAATLRNFTIKGVCGVPSDARSVALNLTVVSPTVDGYVVVWPCGGAFPNVSNINFLAGTAALANGVVVGLYTQGTPDLSSAYGTGNGAGQLHLVLDVTGYFK